MTLFDLTGRVAVVTGGSGTLGTAMVRGLLDAGALACIIGRDEAKATRVAALLDSAQERVFGFGADVMDKAAVEQACDAVLARWGRVDVLVNAAGGNRPAATTGPAQTFFDLPIDAFRSTVDLNLAGTLIPSQVFGQVMAQSKSGSIINISSMAASRPLTRVVAYASGKAAIDNFTRWLAVYMAREVSPGIRVNAIAPGFFLAEQNRAMLVNQETGELTPRGRSIVDHTPMGRFGDPADLVGALVWLSSEASTFVTGTVVPVDGGFSAFAGV